MAESCKMKAKEKHEKLRKSLIVIGSFMCYMIADGATYSFAILYIALLDEFQQPKAVTATIGALMMGLQQISAPLVCAYVGVFGPRLSACTASVILATAFFVTRFAWTIEFLYVSVGVCASLGLELAYVAAMVAIELNFKSNLPLATGIAVSGSGVGLSLFAPMLEYLISEYDWRGACTVLAGVCLHLAVSAAFFVPQRKPTCQAMELRTTGQPACVANHVRRNADTKCQKLGRQFAASMRALGNRSIYSGRFLRFCAASVVVAVAVLVPLTFLVHKAELDGLQSSQAALLLSFVGLASSAGQILVGFLAVKCFRPLNIYLLALSLSGLLIVAMPLTSDFAVLALLAALFGCTYGTYYALMSAMLVEYVSRDLFTQALAFYALVQGCGVLVACPLAGLAVDKLGNYDAVFFAAGSALVLSMNLFLLPDAIQQCRRSRATPVAANV